MITVSHITKAYGKRGAQFTALDDVSLTIKAGKSIAIVGKSGSGKSTLMHVISGLDRVSSGRIVIDGEDIALLKNKALDQFRARKIGFIFQSFFVQANETCAQNVALPLEIARVAPSERKKRVQAALKQVELADKENVKAGKLSGGQKQRLAIARAIVSKPAIIFADEPTGNLDSKTGDAIETLLFNLNKTQKTTLIIVTHDEELAARCEERIYIKDGTIERIETSEKERRL